MFAPQAPLSQWPTSLQNPFSGIQVAAEESEAGSFENALLQVSQENLALKAMATNLTTTLEKIVQEVAAGGHGQNSEQAKVAQQIAVELKRLERQEQQCLESTLRANTSTLTTQDHQGTMWPVARPTETLAVLEGGEGRDNSLANAEQHAGNEMSATRHQQLCATRAHEIFKQKALTLNVGAKRLAGEHGRSAGNGQDPMSTVVGMDVERAEGGVGELFEKGEGKRRRKDQNEVLCLVPLCRVNTKCTNALCTSMLPASKLRRTNDSTSLHLCVLVLPAKKKREHISESNR